MDTFMGSLAIFGSTAILVILVVSVSIMAWQRGWADERPLLIGRMLGRQGVALPDAARLSGGYEFTYAVRRCMQCRDEPTCRAWLESGKKEGYEAFCPNADFIERLKGSATR